ncbi:MAG: alpha/beta fold hydrolase [Xanthomonadales bacterium PRO7]|nr:alpha/beta fold hydrolase [Xanthomonadales bacterium PRO7]
MSIAGKAFATEPRRILLDGADGVPLAIESRGDSTTSALVFAHGFGQTRHAWDVTAAVLANSGWHCLTMDARGHGDSGWRTDGQYEFHQFVDDLVRLARVPAQKPILVGASMGGLLGLVAQAEHELFRAMVLVDITPRWEAAGVERILTFMRAHPQGFANVEEASAAIAHYLPHRAQRKSPERLRSLLVTDVDGRLRWHWDPRLLDTIAVDSEREQARLLAAARRIDVPVLLVSGERSDVVSDATIAEFLHCVPHAQHVRVSRATHMIAGDENAAFTTAVEHFVAPLQKT